MKGKSEQALLVLDEGSSVGNVEKSNGFGCAAVMRDHKNFSGLFDDHQTPGAIRKFLHPKRTIELQLWESHFQLERRQSVGGAESVGEKRGESQKCWNSRSFVKNMFCVVHASESYADGVGVPQ